MTKKLVISLLTALGFSFASFAPAFADTVSVNFENPPYTVGSINGQDGWSATGPYDQSVVSNTYGYASFGGQSFRLSDATASGSFGDWVFAKPLVNGVGETGATAGTYSVGTRQNHFETQFDIASTVPGAQQPGLHVSVSPDRGDGSRMSYLRFEDQSDGIHVFFDDVTDNGPVGTTATFNESDIATLNRTQAHHIKLTLDTVDGPSNDVVNVYIDGVLKKTGTSWENYYRYDPEANTEQSPRIVKTVIFQARGSSTPADAGKGYLFDNFSMSSGPTFVTPPSNLAQCNNNGWKDFNNPSFTNQLQCISYVVNHNHTVVGFIKYNAFGLNRTADLAMSTALNTGTFFYSDANHDSYSVNVSEVRVSGNDAWFAGKVIHATNPSWVGQWLFAKVEDNSPDKIWGTFTDQTTAVNGVKAMIDPAGGSFNVTSGSLSVH